MLIRLNAIILPIALYGCETWSLTLSEEHTFKIMRMGS